MTRLLNPFVLVLTAILAGVYAYVSWRLASGMLARLALAIPFCLIWVVPVVYGGGRATRGRADEVVQFASYVCMGWLNFAVMLSLGRDVLLLATAWGAPLAGTHVFLRDSGAM